jgi:mannosyltransferase
MAPVAGLLLLGAALRLHAFWRPELWTDEYGTWWVVSGTWGDVVSRTLAHGGQSPAYYLLAKLFADGLGPGPLSLRLPAVLAGLGTLAVAYPLARRLCRDDHTALCALAAFAVDGRLIWYGQDARPYAVALLATMLAFLAWVRVLEGGGARARAGYVAAMAALFYAHYLFLVVAVAHVGHLCLRRRLAWLRDPGWLATFAALAVLVVPGLLHLRAIAGRREAMSWFTQGMEAPLTLAVQMLDPPVFAAVGLAVLAVGLEASRGAAEPAGHRDLVLCWLLLPIATLGAAAAALGVALVYTRYALGVAPAGILVLGWLMASGRRAGRGRWLPLAVGLATATLWSLVPALATVGVFGQRPVESWRAVAREIERAAHAGDVILVQPGFVEADLLARGPVDPELAAGLTWPLAANLANRDRYRIVPLPATLSRETAPHVEALAGRLADHPRVWMAGSEEMVARVARALLADGTRQVLQRSAHGATRLWLVARPHRGEQGRPGG